jgi:hypothetical protein
MKEWDELEASVKRQETRSLRWKSMGFWPELLTTWLRDEGATSRSSSVGAQSQTLEHQADPGGHCLAAEYDRFLFVDAELSGRDGFTACCSPRAFRAWPRAWRSLSAPSGRQRFPVCLQPEREEHGGETEEDTCRDYPHVSGCASPRPLDND